MNWISRPAATATVAVSTTLTTRRVNAMTQASAHIAPVNALHTIMKMVSQRMSIVVISVAPTKVR